MPRCRAIAASWAPAGQPSVSSCRRTSSSLGQRHVVQLRRTSAISLRRRSAGRRRAARAARRAAAAGPATAAGPSGCRRRTGTPSGSASMNAVKHRRSGRREVEVVDDDHARAPRPWRARWRPRRPSRRCWRRRAPSSTNASSAHAGPRRRDRRQQAGHEPRRLGVGRVARQPRQVGATLGRPRGERRRLAVARPAPTPAPPG